MPPFGYETPQRTRAPSADGRLTVEKEKESEVGRARANDFPLTAAEKRSRARALQHELEEERRAQEGASEVSRILSLKKESFASILGWALAVLCLSMANITEVGSMYRKRMLALHPDKVGAVATSTSGKTAIECVLEAKGVIEKAVEQEHRRQTSEGVAEVARLLRLSTEMLKVSLFSWTLDVLGITAEAAADDNIVEAAAGRVLSRLGGVAHPKIQRAVQVVNAAKQLCVHEAKKSRAGTGNKPPRNFCASAPRPCHPHRGPQSGMGGRAPRSGPLRFKATGGKQKQTASSNIKSEEPPRPGLQSSNVPNGAKKEVPQHAPPRNRGESDIYGMASRERARRLRHLAADERLRAKKKIL